MFTQLLCNFTSHSYLLLVALSKPSVVSDGGPYLGPSFKPQSHAEGQYELWVLLSIVQRWRIVLLGDLVVLVESLAGAAWVFVEKPVLRIFSY